MNPRYKSLLVYILKNITAVALSYLVSGWISWFDFAWCLISAVLVLSPEGTDAMPLAITRIKANLTGALSGFLILLFDIPMPYNMGAGAVVSLFLCDLFKLNAGAKSTLAAMIIVLMHPEGAHVWDASLGRIGSVVCGCVLGLFVTYVYHKLFRINTLIADGDKIKKDESREA